MFLKATLVVLAAMVVLLCQAEPLRQKPRPQENTAAVEDQGQETHVHVANKASGKRPSPPSGWKKASNPYEKAADTKPAPKTPSKAKISKQKANFGRDEKESEKVRGLLATYRQKVAEKRGKEKVAERKVEINDKLKQQLRMMAAERRAAQAKGFKASKDITQINAPYLEDMLEGDIVLTGEQAEGLLKELEQRQDENNSTTEVTEGPTRDKRSIKNFAYYTSNKWDKSVTIPYAFDSNIDATRKAQILKAINFWSTYTCFYFAETTPTDTTKTVPILLFSKGTVCNSNVGKTTDRTQTINIGPGCELIGIIEHEIGHALGFWHAQTRHDRGSYVTIYDTNVESGAEGNFQPKTETQNNNQGVVYDFGSVMHYRSDAFAIDETQPTVEAKEAHMMNTMGQRQRPSFNDLLIINKAYECTQCSAADYANCQNGGVPNPNWCNQCICPLGFGGTNCASRQAATTGAGCGASLTATDDWQDLVGSINPGLSDNLYNAYSSCHYHITAPAGKTVWVWVEEVTGTCDSGCTVSSVEIKLGQFTRTGMRLCCQSDLGTDGYILAGGESNMAVISLASRSYAQSFKLSYIYT